MPAPNHSRLRKVTKMFSHIRTIIAVSHTSRTLSFALGLLLCCAFTLNAYASQNRAPREHFTPQEIELVRDAQRIDLRIAMFIKAIDRRLLALAALSQPAVGTAKTAAKDDEKYGALPQSGAAELLSDVNLILEEAITNIDDASEKGRQKELLPKAMRKLSEATARCLTQITPLRATIDERTRLILERTIENAEEIVDAAKSAGY